MQTIFDLTVFLSIALFFLDFIIRPALVPGDIFIKIQLINETKIYKDLVDIKKIFKLITEYFSI